MCRTIESVKEQSYSSYFLHKSRLFFENQGAEDWKEEYELFFQSLGEFATGQSVLDIGCGVGTLCIALAKRGYEVTGTDFDPIQIEYGKRLSKEQEIGVKLLRTGDPKKELSNTSFDIVCSKDVIEHLPASTQQHYLRTAFELLRPGGIMCIHTKPTKYSYLFSKSLFWLWTPFAFLPGSLLSRILEISDRIFPKIYSGIFGRPLRNTWTEQPPGHCNCMTLKGLLQVVDEIGFVVRSHMTFGPQSSRFYRLIKLIFGRFEYAHPNIFIVAEKPASIRRG